MVRSSSSSSHLRQAGAELRDSARHVWLAGIGALAKAKDQGAELFESLVQHGREVEAHTVPMLNGLKQQAEELLAGLRRSVSRSAGAKKRAPARSGGAAKRKPAARKKAAASTATRARKTPNRGKAKSSRKRS